MSRGLGAGAVDSGAGSPYQLSPYQCTGLVVDVGESGTSIVPVRASLFCHLPAGSLQLLRPPHVQVVGGFVVRSAVHALPVGGRDVTRAVQAALREGGGVPPDMTWEVARQVCSGASGLCEKGGGRSYAKNAERACAMSWDGSRGALTGCYGRKDRVITQYVQ
jgi:actin-related protein